MIEPIEIVDATDADGLTVGVVSDTHIPDRAGSLHPEMLDLFRAHRVDLILHAGDICIPSVLASLEKVAPVYAVRGNRDFVFGSRLPLVRYLKLAGIQVMLMHGHGGMARYIYDKWFFLRDGYSYQRYQHMLHTTWPQARVVVFGHTHHPENRMEQGRLIFNPGSSSQIPKMMKKDYPSIGILHLRPGEEPGGEVLLMKGADLSGRKWLAVQK
jgi:putative phosphoesterase